MPFLTGITILLIYQLVGEICVRLFELPIPGPVLGMALLFGTLLVVGKTPPTVESASSTILSHLSLLFVPAGVGMMVYADRIAEEWLPIVLVLVFSTLTTMVVTAFVMQFLMRRMRRGSASEGSARHE